MAILLLRESLKCAFKSLPMSQEPANPKIIPAVGIRLINLDVKVQRISIIASISIHTKNSTKIILSFDTTLAKKITHLSKSFAILSTTSFNALTSNPSTFLTKAL